MSLVSTYVVMANGACYKNPTLFDESGDWFICFDDEEPPEIVIRQAVISHSRKSRVRQISEKLEELGISAKITDSRVCGHRNFGHATNDPKKTEFEPAVAAFLKLKKRIPLDHVQYTADSVHVELPRGIECVILDPEWRELKGDLR
ncbi:MAG: hypothetical protein R3250_13885 [Melioribacteraceae bacterium]|nr:hypothetical protein [Melioribacteraceae bacterium]